MDLAKLKQDDLEVRQHLRWFSVMVVVVHSFLWWPWSQRCRGVSVCGNINNSDVMLSALMWVAILVQQVFNISNLVQVAIISLIILQTFLLFVLVQAQESTEDNRRSGNHYGLGKRGAGKPC